MDTLQTPLELDVRAFGAPQYDNSGLRARLGDRVVRQRAVVAELRAAMRERVGEPAARPNARRA